MGFDAQAARHVEALYRSPDIAAQRASLLRLLAPVAGERILDLGCGPGFLVRDLAAALGPTGRVVGLDPSLPMLGLARERCRDLPGVDLREGDAQQLPLADASVDAAVVCQVLEFVPVVERALSELYRVLRPGGRLLVVDTDWASCVWASSDEARMRHVLRAWDAHCPHPQLPRRLCGSLRAAGFDPVHVSVLGLVNAAYAEDTYSEGMIRPIAAFAARDPDLGAPVAAAWEQDLRDRGAAGRYFFSVSRFVFLARKA